jgi:DNA-binding transcriptional MerR regulator
VAWYNSEVFVAETFAEIPDRDVFKASEVCEIAQVQPYVLRSWEQEFPNLGVARSSGAPRLYRRGDVERVLRIKQLVFGDGLTLAGARRQLEGRDVAEPAEQLPGLFDDDARARLAEIRHELRSLLDMLESEPGAVVSAPSHVAHGQSGEGAAVTGGEAAWPPKERPVSQKATRKPRARRKAIGSDGDLGM